MCDVFFLGLQKKEIPFLIKLHFLLFKMRKRKENWNQLETFPKKEIYFFKRTCGKV